MFLHKYAPLCSPIDLKLYRQFGTVHPQSGLYMCEVNTAARPAYREAIDGRKGAYLLIETCGRTSLSK